MNGTLSSLESGLRPLVLQHEIEQFYYDEAALLDGRRFADWLERFEPDLHYWVPTRTNLGRRQTVDTSGPDEAAHFDDTFEYLGYRVARLATQFAWAEQPPSRTRHLIGNVRVTPAQETDEYTVVSNFVITVNRFETDTELFAGERTDLIRRRPDGSLGVARRTVHLDQTVILANSISIFF